MRVAVVGGGLAGLTAAYDLTNAGARVTLIDDGPVPGGQIRTRREQGFTVEDGAEGWVSGSTIVHDLCRDLGIGDQIIPQQTRKSLLLKDGRLAELSPRAAAALLGIPTPDNSEPQGIESLTRGTGSLVEALVDALAGRCEIRQDRAVGISHDAGLGVECASGSRLSADALVLAVPPRRLEAFLGGVVPQVRHLAERITLHNNLSVSLGFRREDVSHPLDASGLAVGDDTAQLNGIRACAFSSSKFGHRAPASMVLLRTFYRPSDDELARPDSDWITKSFNGLRAVLGISGEPVGSWVSRWQRAIPQYPPDHAALVKDFRTALHTLGMIEVAGAAFVPGGIPGAIHGGRVAARTLSPAPLPT